MDKDKKCEIHITNNFNAPIGQHIDHVDTINFRMDGDGTFHFGHVESAGGDAQEPVAPQRHERSEQLCMFIHPSVGSDQEWVVHDEVKRLVTRQRMQEICQYLLQMKKENKVLLPQAPSLAYEELVRMGMPSGEGFNESTFRKYYRNK